MKFADKIFKRSDYRVSSPFGYRNDPFTGKRTFHEGVDYATGGKNWTQYAIEDGYCFASAKSNRDGGNYVWVIYPRIKKALLHYHLATRSITSGAKVVEGTKLGTTGKTGNATGVHLHLGVRDLGKLSDKQVNNMTWDLLRSCSYVDGDAINYIPKAIEQNSAPTASGNNVYTVRAGDTLSKIAKAFNTTVAAIMGANPQIKDANKISVGQTLVIANVTANSKYYTGEEIQLNKRALYATAYAANVVAYKTGTYYIYDAHTINGRYRITNKKENCGKQPASRYVTGYIK